MYCWFSVSRIQNGSKLKSKPFNRLSREPEKREKVTMQTLAKIQVTAMWRSFFPKFIEICTETPCLNPSGWAPTWRRKQKETSVTEFCCKSVNLSLEELKNNKNTFSNTRTVQIAKFSEISHFLTNLVVM